MRIIHERKSLVITKLRSASKQNQHIQYRLSAMSQLDLSFNHSFVKMCYLYNDIKGYAYGLY
jgi:hypothetical protein